MARTGSTLRHSLVRCLGLLLMVALTPAAWSQQTGAKQPGVGYNQGDTAPQLTLRDQDNQPVSLSDFRGRNVLLVFSAAWCGPCMAAASVAEAFVDRLTGKGEPTALVEVLVQNEFGDPSEVIDAQDWADQFNLTTPVLSADGSNNSAAVKQFFEYSKRYGGPAFPTMVLLTPHGRVISAYVGFARARIEADLLQHIAYEERGEIDRLQTDVERLKLGADLTTSLAEPLQAALAAMDARKWSVACQQLASFVDQAQAQRGKGLTEAQGSQLLDAARTIQSDVGCQ
jgi:peroxiredoxin